MPASARDLVAVVVMIVVATCVYLPYALHAGWFYDDWSMYALLHDTQGGIVADVRACAHQIAGGRKLACLYHGVEYNALTHHRGAYHVWSIAFLLLDAVLGYAILRRCRVSRLWAALVGVLLIVFPASDSTRLWPVASIGQYVLALALGSTLVGLVALGREWSPTTVALHALGIGLAVLAMATYEIALPLVGLSGLVYLAAYRNRRALGLGVFDLALVCGFLAWRLLASPPSEATGFVVHRTLGETASRAWLLLHASWDTWKYIYAPGTLGTLALLALLLSAGLLSVRGAIAPRRLLPWAALIVIGTAFAAAASLVFLTANDLYVPAISSTFNRLNLPASLPFAIIFVGLMGAAYEVVRAASRNRLAGVFVVAVVTALVGWHQLQVSAGHKRAWEASWRLQQAALAGYRVALRGVPRTASIVGFDTPLWESDFVPVFSATWDLRGAIDYTTPVDPAAAVPWVGGTSCGATGVLLSGTPFAGYDVATHPLYFVSPTRRQAVRVASRAACRTVLARWGPPAYWAPDALIR